MSPVDLVSWSKSMPDQNIWSTGLGRWLGVNVRVHALLVIGIALILALEANGSRVSSSLFQVSAFVIVGMAIISLLIHEFAHVFAVQSLGGRVNEVVLMPWGGGTDVASAASPSSRVVIYAAGPFANGVLFLMFGFLLTQTNHASWIEVMHPMRPIEFDPGNVQVSALKFLTWINFQLAIVNLIPCFPFDGAHLFRGIVGTLYPGAKVNWIDSFVCMLGTFFGLAATALAFSAWENAWGPLPVNWFVLLIGGISLVYASQSALFRNINSSDSWPESDEELPIETSVEASYNHFDFSDETENAVYSQWLKEKQEERMQQLIMEEEEEDRQADQILGKLHDCGFVSLTTDEKELLDRVSARLRRRRRQQGV